MKLRHFIAMDTHCQFCELVAMTESGRVVRRERCATNIPTLVEAINQVPRPRFLTIEEGTLADWLYRNLVPHVDEMVVCEPRRNHLIAKDSDKDDPIDAEKLANLYRGGYIKPVHHAESFERVVLKRHTALYHDRVRQRVREANRIMSEFRRTGVFIRERDFMDETDRPALLRRLGNPILSNNVELLWKSYDVISEQVQTMRAELIRLGRKEPQVRRFKEVPGLGWIRAVTLFVYLDTPWRFASKQALWRYLGIGLERRRSGDAPGYLGVAKCANRVLKSTILGAAKSAITAKKNPFAKQHERWIAHGLSLRNARRNVARSQAATLWGMWKSGDAYHPQWVGIAAAAKLA